jgi:FkbM family methyltransferase
MLPLHLRFLRFLGHGAFLPEGFRLRAVRALCDPETTPTTEFEAPFFGLCYQGRLDRLIDWHVYFFGSYAPGELACIRDLLLLNPPGKTFVDVGANVGHHTLFVSGLAERVHAFEPWEPVRGVLEDRLRFNTVHNVTVHPVALGAVDRTMTFYAPSGANLGTGSLSPEHARDRNRPSGVVRVVSGDDYFRDQGIQNVSLIKIDVEGWELEVLKGLHHFMMAERPVVFMEYSDTTHRLAGSIGNLLAVLPPGYQPLRVEPRGRSYRLRDVEGSEAANYVLAPHELAVLRRLSRRRRAPPLKAAHRHPSRASGG